MIIIIGLDVGDKRIGVAKTDTLGMMAHASQTIQRTSDANAIEAVQALVTEWQATRIVMGLPKI